MEDPKRLEEGLGHENKDQNEQFGEKVDKTKGGAINHEKEETNTVVVVEQKEDHKQLQQQPLVKQKTKRVATLDAFRGLTVAVSDITKLKNSKKRDAVKKIIIRTLKLLFWGILLQGGYSHAPGDLSYGVNMKFIRWCGILQQRIALVYMFVALIETLIIKQRQSVVEPDHFTIFTAYQWQWIGGFVAFLIYMITTYALYVPDWSFDVYSHHKLERYMVKCGMRGHLGPACNAVGYVDREVWGINHLYQSPVWSRLKACTLSSPGSGPLREDAPSWCRAPFEPEGLLSTISAILSGTIGVHYGHVLIHFKLFLSTSSSTASAMSVSQQEQQELYSLDSILIDVWGLRTPFLFLEWIGMNAMLVYVMALKVSLKDLSMDGITSHQITRLSIGFKNMSLSKFGTLRG
ncbi:hypothetical protein GH714_028583 [Hevea brasiliensis]|uniref:Heparan-alpha-glucosaminide N-acetyltransferase catalytic domain-containing protein n=1 Tax=Hevea brasiliensis TaxID=3981 RepID=A0A6A6M581_HEVBR|nr:hypothetical protein GH714_028583 [Hevea brasiliensis]